jgi:hypothetical protein
MKPLYKNGNVSTRCPDCGGALTTFERKDASREFGSIIFNGYHTFEGKVFNRILYTLMRCARCGRGGLAKIHDIGQDINGTLEWVFPTSVERARLPKGVPPGIEAEFREAEECASVSAWRGASGLLRSTLEKLLRANGYVKGSLSGRIDLAASDGVITEARRRRAHDDVRVLGNDVLHDEWRPVSPEEVFAAHHYVQRIIADLYDDRSSVEAVLKAKGRVL